MDKLPNRRTGEKKRFEHAILDHRHRAGSHTFVVEIVVPDQVRSAIVPASRIELDADEGWQNFLSQHSGKGLAFRDIFLTMTFDAMPEDFMKENSGSFAGEDRGAKNRFSGRRLHE